MTIKAVIFDSDGVLVDSEVLGIAIERQALSELGLRYSDEEYSQRFLGLPDADYLATLERDAQATLGHALPPDFGDFLETRREDVYPRELKPLPGISELVSALPHPTAVASSASVRELTRNLRITGLHDLFAPHIYSGDLVTSGKPSPEIFLYAAERLAISADRTLVNEDSVNGVLAGCAAGMMVWGFIGGAHADAALGHRLRAAGAVEIFESHAAIAERMGL
jgi:HAD superfamily hydrolase (TIGR01509 family)